MAKPTPTRAPRAPDETTSRTRELDAMIGLIVRRAPELIAAGVTSLSLDGVAVTLAPPPPKVGSMPAAAAPAAPHTNPLHDRSTFHGGVVPGFTREGELPDE
jgi:hypothetical protein